LHCPSTRRFAVAHALRERQKKDDPMIIAVWQRFPQTIF